jgi:hypothetical protein
MGSEKSSKIIKLTPANSKKNYMIQVFPIIVSLNFVFTSYIIIIIIIYEDVQG